MIAELFVVVKRKLRVFALGKFALAAVFIHLHQHGSVAVDRQGKAELLEQFHMNGQGGKPLFAPHDMGGAHQMVVHSVREVIGGNPGSL